MEFPQIQFDRRFERYLIVIFSGDIYQCCEFRSVNFYLFGHPNGFLFLNCSFSDCHWFRDGVEIDITEALSVSDEWPDVIE